ncbi:TetR/AcrR family transcriptional regulator [Bradyrhizobium symbiodeficiens]|uniref:TetR/AcrR family transcriptional regulator n=1 Tax=Bradyrhizobium symbiodeficiens TaxID=1404367 RepID=A0ABX5WDZ5_9BRAD|nr:TetR/AcrR family transcriptional regulator [Bradyrhizobium symbiodeficiens]QDF41503.1 TetR/AcrR family transcriptional regulator [Bradyrhizobium symbiodeficiens]
MDSAPPTPPSSPPSSPWLPFESRRRARDEKREAVLRAAVQLFLEQGYHRVTLNEVAERLNITKPALYNYFRGKDEILFECWSMGAELVDSVITEINAGSGSGLARLRKLVHAYAALMATDFGASLVRFDLRDLTERNAAVARAAKKRIDATFRDYIAAGMADGSINACDPKLAAFAIAGSLNWIGHWYRRDGGLSPTAIADEFTVRLTEGLAAAGPQHTIKKTPGAPQRRNSGRKTTGKKRTGGGTR